MNKKIKVPLLLSVLLNCVLIVWMLSMDTPDDLPGPHMTSMETSSNLLEHTEIRRVYPARVDIFSDTCQVTDNHFTSATILQGYADTFKTIIPPPQQFNSTYENPCWHMHFKISQKLQKLLNKEPTKMTNKEVSIIMDSMFKLTPPKSLVCIPKVFFIGFPRSGSTQLYKMLIQHPQIKGGINKEPHWWTKKIHHASTSPQMIINIVRYINHFKSSSEYVRDHPNTLLIDGSQSTIWDTRSTGNLCLVPRLMSEVIPNAKYIVLMRNPIQRLYSDFSYLCEEYRKKKNLPRGHLTNSTEVFHQNALGGMEALRECLEKVSLEKCAHQSLLGQTSGCGRVRLGISLYHVHIQRWLREVPKKQFLFLRTDELATEPLQVLKEVWKFLGVAEQNAKELKDILHTHLHTSHSPQAGRTTGVGRKTEEMLRSFFQPHNDALAELLGDERFGWA